MIFENLKTERLLFKNIEKDDRDFIFSMFSDVDVNKYLFDKDEHYGLRICFVADPEGNQIEICAEI